MDNTTRSVQNQVRLRKTVETIEIGMTEEIISINHNLSSKSVEVFTRIFNGNNDMLKNESTIINGPNYLELVENSNSLIVTSDKVWEFVDKVRNSI